MIRIKPSSCSLLAAFCFYAFSNLIAQEYAMKWGKIPAEDLSMTVYPPDTAADAVVLGNYSDLEFGLIPGDVHYNYFHHKRIKILKRSGFRKGDVILTYYPEGEKISNLHVQVVTPDGKKYTLKNDDIFEEAVNKHVSRRRFSAPNLCEGAVLEYRYNLTSSYIFSLPEWYFQEDIPTRRSECRVAIPDRLDYAVLVQFLKENTASGTETGQHSTINTSVTFEKSLSSQEASIKRYRYFMNDAAALREESFITTMKDYYARLQFQLAATAFPGQGVEQVMSTWEKVSKDLLEDGIFGLQFLKFKNYKNANGTLAPLLTGVSDNNEKINIIYKFLTNTMKWNSQYSFQTNRSLDECFEQKSGSSGELNMLFLALLKENGIQAHPLLVSTRSHGNPIELYPIMDQFNHVAVWVEYEGQWIMADIASPHYALGYPRIQSLNKRAFLIRESNPRWIDVPRLSGSSIKLATLKLREDGNATGTMQYRMQGYDAMFWREKLANNDKDETIKNQLARSGLEMGIENIEVHGLKDLKEPLEVSFGITLPEMAVMNGDVLYLNSVLDPLFTENPFKLADRSFPVEIPHTISDKYFLQLELPEGYDLEENPDPIRLFLTNNSGSYQATLTQTGNKLSLSTEFKVNQLRYEANVYRNLRELFDRMLEKQQNPIVLKRKS